MRGLATLSILLLVPLAVSCATGEIGDLGAGGRGGVVPGSSSGGGSSTGGSSSASTGSSSTSSSSSTGSSGEPPTTCAQADGAYGCCAGDTLYYCLSGNSVTIHSCTHGDVCGWSESDGFYDCVTTPGADPSGKHPEACN